MTVQTVSNQIDQTVSKKSKSWYKRKRFWFFVIFVLLVYFCLVPSPTRISIETTGITEPLNVDGEVDYFNVYEKTYIDKLSPPEDNGQRLMIAAFGPRVLEQPRLANTLQWEEIPTHQDGKDWFEKQWIPLCEHLYIDPYRKPMFYDKRGFHPYMDKYFDEQDKTTPNKSTTNHSDKIDELFKKLTSVSWKREDYPEVGKWLDEYSEVLDYYGMCVRKPNFVSWRQGSEDSLFVILLPDVQANRAFVRSLQIRIMERIGRNDIEGAFYDVMSIKHLVRHYSQESILVINLVGFAVNDIANHSIKQILANCSLTEEQLAKFKNELDSLPKYNSIASCLLFERAIVFQMLQFFKNKKITTSDINEILGTNDNMLLFIFKLPFDANIAGKHLTKLYNEVYLQNNKYPFDNPILRKQYLTSLEYSSIVDKTYKSEDIMKRLCRIPLIRTRSKLIAEITFVNFIPALGSAFRAFDRCDAENEMSRIAISLERYKLANGKYPDNLEALVPKYLDMMPIDPCTGRTTFVYKLRETSTENTTEETPKPKELPYILYSLGPNAKDDGGIPVGQKGQKFNEYDFVF